MSRVNFTTIHTGDSAVDRVQTHIQTALRPLLQNPLGDGALQKEIELGVSEVLVSHGLGRRPEGFIVTRQNASASIYESSTATFPDRQIALTASATVTADIYFF